jgi:hypothetical protein
VVTVFFNMVLWESRQSLKQAQGVQSSSSFWIIAKKTYDK